MTQVWAHRGARREAPENTLPAFERAVEQGADGVELDVQLTADGIMVVIHDETLDRTTNGSGLVAVRTLAELQCLDASAGMPGFAGTRIPTLNEVLDLLVPTGVMINIELKNSCEEYPGLERQVLEAVTSSGAADQVVLSTFNHYSLKALQELGATSELGMLYSDPLYNPWSYALGLNVGAIHPPVGCVLGPVYVRCAQESGLAVRPWVANHDEELRRLFKWGVDAVFTDVPGHARRIRDDVQPGGSRRSWRSSNAASGAGPKEAG